MPTLRSSIWPLDVVRWDDASSSLSLLDQTRLPAEVVMLSCRSVQDAWDAIARLSVRGAPAIGIAAAYAVCLAFNPKADLSPTDAQQKVAGAIDHLATSRPTAVNLFWALDRMREVAQIPGDPAALHERLLREAKTIHEQDRQLCEGIGKHGADHLRTQRRFLTHCNAGALATGGIGTALAPIYELQTRGESVEVFADETRPLMQGSRLTAWELSRAGVPVTIITDSMAGSVLAAGKVDAVIVGADRITARGDVANKIGTYPLAVLARYHGVPFYVAAPHSTFDLALRAGAEIMIEQRASREITHAAGWAEDPMTPGVYNPAFDVTPAELVTAIITDFGVIQSPSETAVRTALERLRLQG